MANIRPAVLVRNAMLQTIIDRINLGSGPGTIKLYTGTQPADGDAALAGNVLLATLTFADPCAGAPAAGAATFSTIAEDSAADATGTATWARIQDSAGVNVFDGNVGTTDAFIIFNRVDFVAGGPVRITSFVLTVPATLTF